MGNKYGLSKDIAEDIESGNIQKALEKASKAIDEITKQNMDEDDFDRILCESIGYYDPFGSVWYVGAFASAYEGFKNGLLNPISMEIKREPVERTISDIKKEIKHERNPLRLKQLNRELNAKYKELKKGRR